ncbi:MAG: CrcB family protein [Actinobacteria bacterium]|nr:CrcB family protein [Actinomycetota bacterium]
MIAAAVIVAGALAAVARWLVARWLSSAEGAYRNLPIAVLIVNVVGSALGGAVLGLATAGGVDAGIRLVLLTGLCGGLTTFSTFSVETVQYVTEGKWRIALASVVANLVLGIGAAAGAYALTV